MAKRISTHDVNRKIGLNRASYMEMFFDMVFMFCMRYIIPESAESSETVISAVVFYAFFFSMTLALQIWVNTTIVMNRFGRGTPADITLIVVNVLLVAIMFGSVTPDWERFYVFNICWMLILANLCVHLLMRIGRLGNSNSDLKGAFKRAFYVMLGQVALVAIGMFLDKFWGQLFCLAAVILGLFAWVDLGKCPMGTRACRHIVDRGPLVIMVCFGESLVEAATFMSESGHMLSGAFYVLIVVMMFLIYLIEHGRALDPGRLGSGLFYLVVTGTQTFLLACVAFSFETMVYGRDLWIMDGSVFFSLSVAAFLLSFFLYRPLNKQGRTKGKRWELARVIACLGSISLSVFLVSSAASTVMPASVSSKIPSLSDDLLLGVSTFIGLVAVVIVFVLDWRNYGNPPKGIMRKLYGKKNSNQSKGCDQ